MKNEKKLEETWNDQKHRLKQKFIMLTDSDVLLVEGKHDELISRLQAKLGKTKVEIQKLISEL
jgi:uncharacterized protein YjbJ (UPF0337 family)